MNTDLTNLIERLDPFEDRLNVSLKGLFSEQDENGYVTVNGELHSLSGTTIENDIRVHTTVYDAQGRVIHTTNTIIFAEGFFAFEPFNEIFTVSHPIAKIRVYPKES